MKSPKNPAPSGESSPQKPQDWLSIRASAGSGKTFALTLRFVYLALLGAKISEILTITFTIKARTEMQERILGALQGLSSDNYQKSAYFASLRGYGLGAVEIHTRARRCLDEFLHAKNHILTFDAFFRMVLERFSFYAGLAQNFEISSTQKPKNAAFEGLLGAMKKSDFARLADFCSANDLKAAGLLKMIESQKIPENRESSGVDDGFLRQNIARDYNNLRAWLLGALPKEGGRKITDIRGRLENVATEANCIKVVTEHTDNGLIFTPTMFKTLESLGLSSRVEGDLAAIKSNLKIFFAQREAQVLGMIARLQRDYERRKISALIEANRLGFDDVSFFCHKLLGEEGHIERDFFYFRLDSRIRHILVDEFQDTNARQLGILKPLIEEIKSGEGRLSERSLFFVGDEKQAIYGFRGSDSGLFGEVSASLQMSKEELRTNYRSAKNIVDFVNRTFAGRFEGYFPQEAHSDKNGFVKIRTNLERDDILAAVKSRVDFLLSRQLSSGRRSDSDIAILVRQTETALEIKDFLLSHNPALKIALSTKTSDSVEFLAITNALKYIKGDCGAKQRRLYLKNALNLSGESFFAGESGESVEGGESGGAKSGESGDIDGGESSVGESCGDEDSRVSLGGGNFGGGNASGAKNAKKIPQLLDSLKKDDAPHRLVFAIMGAFEMCGKVAFSLLENACKHDDLGAFLETLEDDAPAIEEEKICDVRINTIHKSKGLQFRDVIVCEYRRLGSDSDSFFYDYEGLNLSGVSYLKDANARRWVDDDFARIHAKMEAKKNGEKMNLLYVAFTRAKESLCVFAPRTYNMFKDLELEDFEDGEGAGGAVLDGAALGANLNGGANHGANPAAEPPAPPAQIIQKSFGRQDDFITRKAQKYSSHARIRGIALHLFMEHLLKYEGADDFVRQAAKNRFGLVLTSSELEALEVRARRLLESKILQDILRQAPKRHCEVSYLDKNRNIRRIDCILETEGEAFVLEFKSSKSDLEANAAQLREYVEFVGAHFGGKKVSALLCFADSGEILVSA